MGDKSKIAWCDATLNVVTGCTPFSKGCYNCYAKGTSEWLHRMGTKNYENGFKVTCHPHMIDQMHKWKKSRRIFVCSMSDLFHDDVSYEFLYDVYKNMVKANHHIFLILTKRAESMHHIVSRFVMDFRLENMKHIHHGVTVENIDVLDRIDWLKKTPSWKKFVSFEPLLGPIVEDPLIGQVSNYFHAVDQVIIGGEGGSKARMMKKTWAEDIIMTAFGKCKIFMKQFGTAYAKENGLKSKKGEDPEEWDKFYRRRELI